MQKLSIMLLTWLWYSMAVAGSLNELRQALIQSAKNQVQEKVYIHTDNECYFVGDTLWYKAYVVRADRLVPTDMSRILYVELLSPDGLLVERQNIIISPRGLTCGQFVLQDSLYSGYYELRAYTRWMLNFNVGHKQYSTDDARQFYSKQMAADYYRTWEGLYSRVLPVYSKPDKPGDYSARRMYERPKQRLPRAKKDQLMVAFYPEGGHLIQGTENRVAFEITDQNGEAVSIDGTITADGQQPIGIKTEYMGRGTVNITPTDKPMKAHFKYHGKQYDIALPTAEPTGFAIRMAHNRFEVRSQGLQQSSSFAVSILCRGVLQYFKELSDPTSAKLEIPLDSLESGVNEITLFDNDGRIWASRLFFVNHHENDEALIIPETVHSSTHTFQPYEHVEMQLRCTGVTEPTTVSLSVRDTNTDEPTYNDGDIMTDLLLSSDLRGFIARPAHYFEADDEEHWRHLDLLMMVQGWRKYRWEELADTTHQTRYLPEKTMTVSGTVHKTVDQQEVELEDISMWSQGMTYDRQKQDDDQASTETSDETTGTSTNNEGSPSYIALDQPDNNIGLTKGNLHKEVMVEAEVIVGNEIYGSSQMTHDHGSYLFQIPPFYGNTYINLKAYNENDSVSKSLNSRTDKNAFQEDREPDYYVKRDMPYPRFTDKYSFYQNHAPDAGYIIMDTLSELSMENEVHQLGKVEVKGKRHGKRSIDWSKPAFVCNAYDIYNELTDYGMSFGRFRMDNFPAQVCRFLYGNMGRHRHFNIDARFEGDIYWRNYSDIVSSKGTSNSSGQLSDLANMQRELAYLERQSKHFDRHNGAYLTQNLKLRRLQDVRVFSDYEPRNDDNQMEESLHAADATVDMVPIPNNGRQLVYRDRHIYLHGFNQPAQFYQPDYSNWQPAEPTDYRRTLYWNPNAVTDGEGRLSISFYNNSKETRICISGAGITADGLLLHSKPNKND